METRNISGYGSGAREIKSSGYEISHAFDDQGSQDDGYSPVDDCRLNGEPRLS